MAERADGVVVQHKADHNWSRALRLPDTGTLVIFVGGEFDQPRSDSW